MRFFRGIACYICHMVWKPLKWPNRNFPHLQNIKIPKNHREIQNWKFMFFWFFGIFSQKIFKVKISNSPKHDSTGFKCFCGPENDYTYSFWHTYHDSRPQGSIFRVLKKIISWNFSHIFRLGIFPLKTVVKKISKTWIFNCGFLDDFLVF